LLAFLVHKSEMLQSKDGIIILYSAVLLVFYLGVLKKPPNPHCFTCYISLNICALELEEEKLTRTLFK